VEISTKNLKRLERRNGLYGRGEGEKKSRNAEFRRQGVFALKTWEIAARLSWGRGGGSHSAGQGWRGSVEASLHEKELVYSKKSVWG